MIGARDQKGMPKGGEVNAFLGRGTTFEGKITFEGMFRLDGKFDGEIFAGDFLVVGESGQVNAQINVNALTVNGSVSGNITAKTRVEIHPPGRVIGDIKTPVLIISEGALFDGNCQMEKVETRREEKISVLKVKGDDREESELKEIEKKSGS
ncbi:MAG: polymer-forming cytoskeletal protein [Proteobacteria bacterium]|nr:polymer-forming cytoskeletal protein [Pseudomonadota bacterium]NIS68222.1 polymer-forming cytoskeletal protein [Pseudomonadota bacterium]